MDGCCVLLQTGFCYRTERADWNNADGCCALLQTDCCTTRKEDRLGAKWVVVVLLQKDLVRCNWSLCVVADMMLSQERTDWYSVDGCYVLLQMGCCPRRGRTDWYSVDGCCVLLQT